MYIYKYWVWFNYSLNCCLCNPDPQTNDGQYKKAPALARDNGHDNLYHIFNQYQREKDAENNKVREKKKEENQKEQEDHDNEATIQKLQQVIHKKDPWPSFLYSYIRYISH